MRQHSVTSLLGAQLDYWVARAAGKAKPVITYDKRVAECLVEVDGTVFETFSPTKDTDLADRIVSGSDVRLMRVSTPIGFAWAGLTPTGFRVVSTSWRYAALQAFVAQTFGAYVFDEVTV